MEDEKYKVSIIMPIYNAATRGHIYFQQAIKSVINQSYRNIELILIDDGSPDGAKTAKLLKKVSEWDQRIKIVNKGYNSGVEDTRRIGISLSNGDFIMHMDQDDYYYPYAIETLINNYEKTQADIIVANSVRCIFSKHLKYGKNRISNAMRQNKVVDNFEFINGYYGSFFGMKAIPVAVWNKMYLASFIKSAEEPPRVNYAEEDINYNMHIFPQAKKISLCKDITHLWRWGGVSSSGSNHFDIDARRRLYNNKVSLIEKYKCTPRFLESAALEMMARYDHYFNQEARSTSIDDFKTNYNIHIRDKEFNHAMSIVKDITHPNYIDLMLNDDIDGLYKELINRKVPTNSMIGYAKKFLGII